MKFRQHCGSLQDSLATEVEIEPTLEALRRHLVGKAYRPVPFLANKARCGVLRVQPVDVVDDRTEWPATHLVTLDGDAIGYCSQVPGPGGPGLQKTYQIAKADGRPVSAQAKYFVLRYDLEEVDGDTEYAHRCACRTALRAYANSINNVLPELAADIHGVLDQTLPHRDSTGLNFVVEEKLGEE